MCGPPWRARKLTRFEPEGWRQGALWSCTPIRQRMAPDLVASGRLVGATRAEVEALLGEPARAPRLVAEQPRWEGALVYLLGPDHLGVDDEWLVVQLEDGARVREVLIVGD